MTIKSIPIRGMTCAACARASERAAGSLPGVAHASVNFATETLTIEYDESALGLEAVAAAIKDAGYEAVLPTAEKSATVPIGRMTCPACPAAVELESASACALVILEIFPPNPLARRFI